MRRYYHTQESRRELLIEAIPCTRDDAWLGHATYFWLEEFDAENWGHDSKRGKGYFEIYVCDVETDDVLDTVFNEEHYFFWLRQVEKVAKKIIAKTHMKPSLKELNDYFKERGDWEELSAIQFQDLPTNNNHLLVKPIEYKNKTISFAYRKRIQLAVYNQNIITNFALLKREKCINF